MGNSVLYYFHFYRYCELNDLEKVGSCQQGFNVHLTIQGRLCWALARISRNVFLFFILGDEAVHIPLFSRPLWELLVSHNRLSVS